MMPISLSSTKSKIRRIIGASAAISLVAGLGASSASAKSVEKEIPVAPVSESVANVENEASAKVSAILAVCPGQTFSQPFEALGDSNYYTLAAGSEFNSGPEGWELLNGAQIVVGTRPDGSTGNVLDLPSGAVAVSPPTCVTLQYPTARTYVESVQGDGAVNIAVAYGLGKHLIKSAGQLKPKSGQGWELSSPFNVRPETTGKEEGTREVRFVYSTTGKNTDEHVFGLYIDPRLSH